MIDDKYASHPVLIRIVKQLEDDGLNPYGYSLPDYVDLDEVLDVTDSGEAIDEITFFIKGRTVTVSGSGDVYIRS